MTRNRAKQQRKSCKICGSQDHNTRTCEMVPSKVTGIDATLYRCPKGCGALLFPKYASGHICIVTIYDAGLGEAW